MLTNKSCYKCQRLLIFTSSTNCQNKTESYRKRRELFPRSISLVKWPQPCDLKLMVLLSQSRLYGSNVDTRGWGTPHMKGVGMVVGNFELNPWRRPIWAWSKLFLTPKRDHVCSSVIGRPFDDPKGRWRVGGGINVPVKIKMEAARKRTNYLKSVLGQESNNTEAREYF